MKDEVKTLYLFSKEIDDHRGNDVYTHFFHRSGDRVTACWALFSSDFKQWSFLYETDYKTEGELFTAEGALFSPTSEASRTLRSARITYERYISGLVLSD